MVFCSCHNDIIPYLQPSWVYDTDSHQFYNGRYLQRPKREIKVLGCDQSMWDMFKDYHYLSGELNKAATCYVAVINNEPIAFIALLSLPGRDVKHAWREHRVVVLPDFQGMGIGNKLSEMIAQAYIEKGCRYFSKTANPRMGEHRDRSPLWRATVNNRRAREDYIKSDGTIRTSKYSMSETSLMRHAHRECYSHEYIGDGTKYPYTYVSSDDMNAEIEGQLSMFEDGVSE